MVPGTTSGRRDSRSKRRGGQMYVYGNTVAKPSYEPKKRAEQYPEKQTSRQVQKNRDKALHMNSGYVMFLAVAAALALVICVNYIQLQSKIASSSKNITKLQRELADLKEENNTRYNSLMDSVNLEEIRVRAEEMGMVYASPEQVVEYKSPSTDYVKQHESIPENGVLAQSDKNE